MTQYWLLLYVLFKLIVTFLPASILILHQNIAFYFLKVPAFSWYPLQCSICRCHRRWQGTLVSRDALLVFTSVVQMPLNIRCNCTWFPPLYAIALNLWTYILLHNMHSWQWASKNSMDPLTRYPYSRFITINSTGTVDMGKSRLFGLY